MPIGVNSLFTTRINDFVANDVWNFGKENIEIEEVKLNKQSN